MSASPHFGEMLAFREQSSAQLARWLASVDPGLALATERQAALRGETLAQFVRIAVSDFLAEADEEAWTGLVSAIRNARDPAARCLEKMVQFRVELERAP